MNSNMQKQRVTARITGVVQGVFYRASAQKVARSLSLVGWVRNTEDAVVGEVISSDIPTLGQELDFKVRR